jgi:hypothetical protein
MEEPWSDEFAARVRERCDAVSALGVDGLVDAGLVAKGEFERASSIVAEELFVRLCLHDYPPAPGSLDRAPDSWSGAAPHRRGTTAGAHGWPLPGPGANRQAP